MSDFTSISLMSRWFHLRSLVDYFSCIISSAVSSVHIMEFIQCCDFFFKDTTISIEGSFLEVYLDECGVSACLRKDR